jgi:hypothetical protein
MERLCERNVTMATSFSAETVAHVGQAEEIELETRAAASAPTRRTIIWIVADRANLYVRSVRGPQGKWYQRVQHHPRATLHAGGQTLTVRLAPVTDTAEIDRISAAYRRKYAADASAVQAMLAPATLPTTMKVTPA